MNGSFPFYQFAGDAMLSPNRKMHAQNRCYVVPAVLIREDVAVLILMPVLGR